MLSRLRSHIATILMYAAILILAVNLGLALWVYARHAVMAVNFPYPLDYGEGPVLDQVLHLAHGEAIYRSTISTPPYTVTNYPPLYLLLQEPLARSFGLALWYGRVISIVSLVLAAVFLGLTIFELSRDPLAAATGSLLLFAIPYFVNISVLDRVDTLALALSWAGLYTLVRWPDRRMGIVAVGLLFSASIFTQQTYLLVAPMTALTWLLQTRRVRPAVELLAVTGVTCVALFVGMNALTRGGFALNLLTYTTNPWSYSEVAGKLIEIGFNTFFLGLIALAFFIGERLDMPTRTWPFVLPYFLAALLISLIVGKTGPSDQTMFELAAALCLVSGAAMAWMKNPWARMVLLVLLSMQVNSLLSWTGTDYQPKFAEKFADQTEIASLDGIIRGADGPILADETMGLLPLAGKQVYYQPFEFSQLAQAGLWDPAPLIQAVTQQKFSAVLVYFPPDFRIIQARWSDQFLRTVSEAYANTQTLAYTLVFMPKK
jgi:hypothetical protein